jgi:hypothetical protein
MPDAGMPVKHVFMVGFPRSGTTLLEQVLDSHSAVATTGERVTLEESARELRELARKENAAAEEALRKGGMTMIKLTPSGRAAFVAATRGAYDTQPFIR